MPAIRMLSMGLYSSHSPGLVGRPTSSTVKVVGIPQSTAVRAFSADAADKYATETAAPIRIAVVTKLGQRKIVCESGMIPLIASSEGGIAAFVAMSIAADDESPIAQVTPSPR